ncbi:hypothetical protein [Oceanobacillus oncorhynchi]|uniref:hypothetical protein n=1 Tax=Oceanobacillus oncorhynchi TaxID=545501 RepID=UPI0025A3668B|nr:hypothetical protein [Oceanobacillus oncorhynchi]MDM8098679.1 hypothetical protein [Oceanobacillus oncorhynchi]
MDERLEEIKGEQFADLEQAKIDILKEKLYLGLQEFAENQGQQWTGLRFEKPLLTKLLSLIQQAEKAQELESDIKANKKSVDWLLYQNKRYKEALEDIKINSRSDVNRAIEKACKALEGEST